MPTKQLSPPQQLVVDGLTKYPLLSRSMLTTVTGLSADQQRQALEELTTTGLIGRAWQPTGRRATEVFFLAESRNYLAPYLTPEDKK